MSRYFSQAFHYLTGLPKKIDFKKIDIGNFIFLVALHIAGVAGAIMMLSRRPFVLPTAALALAMAVLTGLAITVGYHRLFSHRTFEASWPVRLLLLLFGAAAFQNSAKRWSSDHRKHHKFVDTDKDPYSIKKGFFHAHMGWVLLKYDETHSYDDVPDLIKDPFVQFQDRFYIPLAVIVSFLLPTLLAGLWGDMLGGFFIAGWLRLLLNEHFTFFINSAAHVWGRQPYSDEDSSKDNFLLAFFTYGEGYHNFHHTFPFDYRNGVRAWHWDPSKWTIWLLAQAGIASGLKRSPRNVILRAHLRMDEKKLLERLNYHPAAATLHSRELITRAREKLEQAHAQFHAMKTDYERLKKENTDAIKEHLHKWNHDLIESKMAVINALNHWHTLCATHGIPPTPAWI